ncbi:MAG: FAD-dependent oxidoreductase, partial [Caldilineaceae bacterium]
MSNAQSTTSPQQIIICGGGVIGACIAYYLSRHPQRADSAITVVERTGVANASSGKSGGFLALDWCRGTPVDALARRSFALHAELAATLTAELNLAWGYRPIDTLSVVASEGRDLSRMGHLPTPSWLGQKTAVHSRLGDEQTTAQIDPAAFTRSMMQAAQAHGVQLRQGTVEGVTFADDGQQITGVQIDGETVAADAVV